MLPSQGAGFLGGQQQGGLNARDIVLAPMGAGMGGIGQQRMGGFSIQDGMQGPVAAAVAAASQQQQQQQQQQVNRIAGMGVLSGVPQGNLNRTGAMVNGLLPQQNLNPFAAATPISSSSLPAVASQMGGGAMLASNRHSQNQLSNTLLLGLQGQVQGMNIVTGGLGSAQGGGGLAAFAVPRSSVTTGTVAWRVHGVRHVHGRHSFHCMSTGCMAIDVAW